MTYLAPLRPLSLSPLPRPCTLSTLSLFRLHRPDLSLSLSLLSQADHSSLSLLSSRQTDQVVPPEDLDSLLSGVGAGVLSPDGRDRRRAGLRTQSTISCFSTFVLTSASGDKVYGAAIEFYESFPRELLSEQQCVRLGLLSVVDRRPVSGRNLHVKKSICVLSTGRSSSVFQKFLTFVYRYSISGPHVLPLEKWSTNADTVHGCAGRTCEASSVRDMSEFLVKSLVHQLQSTAVCYCPKPCGFTWITARMLVYDLKVTTDRFDLRQK
ncbi:hypothetical protein WMY93_026364 [Mugilogobius chulae]|uniref:Uncharacterized protein n=1 Tax=Mugilogobius chulae TaxID=88201 RepID=A0AAW0N8A4_9GOBI